MLYSRKIGVAFAFAVTFLIGCTLKTSKDPDNEDESSERDGIEQAMKQEFLMTRDPALGYVPTERLLAALRSQERLVASRQYRTDAIDWEERGPVNPSGRTRAFFLDSRDPTGNTVFAASVSGGIWKATNFKSTPVWTPVGQNMGSIAVCAMAQDPSNPNIMYAGTGEGWFNIDAVRGNGIWRSADGGTTWAQLASTDSSSGGGTNFNYIQDLAVTSNGTLFATSRPSRFCNTGGVFRFGANGATWTRVIGSITGQTCATAMNYYAADLEVASNGDLYATTGFIGDTASNLRGRIFRSSAVTHGTNVGNTGTWVDITPAGTWGRIELATAPGNPATIYALLAGSESRRIGGIRKSIDFGATWTELPLPLWCNQGTSSTDFTNGQAIYDLIVQVDPTNANNVYIGGIDLFKSTNGGASWNQISQWARNCSDLPVVHADQHNIKFLPGSGTEIYASNDGGIYYSNNAGTSWATFNLPNINGVNQTTYSSKNIGYNVTQLYAADLHPIQTNYFLIGMQDNGSHKLTSAGISTSVEASLGGDGGYCHIDQVDGNIQILSYVYNEYYYSRNGGNSFTRANFNRSGFFINPSDFDDARKVLYTSGEAGNLGVISGFAGTATPTFASVPLNGLGVRKVSAVKIDPTVSGGGTVWVAGTDTIVGSNYTPLAPVLIKVTNANTSPSVAVSTVLSGVSGGSYVSSIDVDPANAAHILVTLANYGVTSVYESTNGGTSFSPVEGNLPDIPVRWGMFVPANASVGGVTGGGILLATEIGVWFTQQTAGLATLWTPQNTGLPNVRCDMLRYRPGDNVLAVATHGRGLFTTKLTALTTGVPSVPNTRNFIEYAAANRQQLFIKTGNLSTTTMEIRLFDVNGRLVYSAKTAYANQTIPLDRLASGSYVVKIYGNKNEQYTRQFIK